MGKRIHRVGVAKSSPATYLLLLLSLIIVITSDNIISTVDGAPDTTVLGRDCGTAGTWAPGDPYGDLVNDLLDELATETPGSDNYVYSDTASDGTSSVYGSAQCSNANLDQDECRDCLNACVADLANNCLYSISATVTMVDCQLRYDKQS